MRGLARAEGESADVLAAWFESPEMRLDPLGQWYIRLDATTDRDATDSGFEAMLVIDDSGLVVSYEDG